MFSLGKRRMSGGIALLYEAGNPTDVRSNPWLAGFVFVPRRKRSYP
jgi:hypothetical protein